MGQDLNPYDIQVELTLLPEEESGWHSRIYPGYRAGHIYLDGIEWVASFYPKDRTELLPGETGPVLVSFFFRPDGLVGRLWVGRELVLMEGAKTIGRGSITAMLKFDAHVEAYLRRKASPD